MDRKFGAFSSSVNPQELATSVTGVIKAVGGVLVFLGFSAITGEVNSLAEQMGQIVTIGYAFWGASETAFGLIRKIVVAVTQR